jgi:1-acyl-sn-glycerol-3-phosphate acyltransferase
MISDLNGGLKIIMASADIHLPDPRDRQKFVYQETVVRKIATLVIGTFLKAFTEMTVEGLENFPSQGACIIASNHLSNVDVFPIQLALPRPLFFMGKAELFKNPIMDWGLRQLGGFPVQRGVSDQWALNHAKKILDKGLILAMFPEGTRSKNRGLSVAKTGAARLAIEKNVSIVPLAHYGSDKMFAKFPQRSPVRLIVSPPIFPDRDDDPLSLTDRVMFSLASHLPRKMRGAYSELPPGFKI